MGPRKKLSGLLRRQTSKSLAKMHSYGKCAEASVFGIFKKAFKLRFLGHFHIFRHYCSTLETRPLGVPSNDGPLEVPLTKAKGVSPRVQLGLPPLKRVLIVRTTPRAKRARDISLPTVKSCRGAFTMISRNVHFGVL